MSMARMALRRKASRVGWHSNSHILAQRFGAGSLVNGPQRSPHPTRLNRSSDSRRADDSTESRAVTRSAVSHPVWNSTPAQSPLTEDAPKRARGSAPGVAKWKRECSWTASMHLRPP
jgi:hypothetical protein